MKYFINYGTGAGDEYVDGTLANAKKAADEGVAYTGENVKIFDGDNVAAMRRWYDTVFNPDDYDNGEAADVIRFGTFGHYGEWQDA